MITKSPMSKMLRLLLVASMVMLVACGSDDDDDATTVVVGSPDNEQREEGVFQTPPMVVVNNSIENNVKAVSKVEVDGDDVTFEIECMDAPENVIHKQYIHTGVTCPSIADDRNGDGIVDWEETQQVAGPVLLSMDRQIESSNDGGFPIGRRYNYVERASLTAIRDILPQGEVFSLEGRVVIIYGVSPSTNLPDTVATNGDEPANVNIPISCAVINQVADTTTGGTTGATTGGTTGQTTGGTTGQTTGGTTGSTTGGTTGQTTGGTTGQTTGGTTGQTTGGTTAQ